MNTLDQRITIFQDIVNPETVFIKPLSKAIERIRNPKTETLQIIERLRSGELTIDQYRADKKKLPGYIFSGEFHKRAESGIKKYSGIIVLDLDKLQEVDRIKAEICKDPFTLACFLSPGGNGLKVLVKLPNDPARDPKEQHEESYYSLEHYYKTTYNLETDKQCKDLARACFDSYDPEIFVNEGSQVYDKPRPIESPLNQSAILESVETATTAAAAVNEEKIKELLGKMDLVQELSCREIVKSSPLIYLNEEPYIFKNTINMIQSKEGSHKSRLVNVLISSMVKTSKTSYHFLGYRLNEEFSSPPPLIILFDTEQDLKEQVPARLQLIKSVAGFPLEEAPENLRILPLVEFRQDEILENIRLVVSHYRAQFPDKHLFVVIDIVSDLVKNINDAEKSSELINELNILANKNDCTILTTIHINPLKERGSESKARGHLGTELKNKVALSVEITRSRVKNEPEDNPAPIYKISTRKNRKGKIHPSFRVVFDESSKLLRLATIEETEKVQEVKSAQELLGILFEKFRINSFNLKQDKETLTEIFGLKETGIKRNLAEIERLGYMKILSNPIEVRLSLTPSKGGRPNSYRIVEKGEEIYSTTEGES